MVVKRQCSFCASEIEPGTGWTFVKRDGTVFHFCSSSCRKQQLHLGRVGHRFKWTRAHALRVAAEHSTSQKKAPTTPSPAAKVRRGPHRGSKARATTAPPTEPESAAVESPPTSVEPAPTETEPAPKAPTKRRTRARKKPASSDTAKE